MSEGLTGRAEITEDRGVTGSEGETAAPETATWYWDEGMPGDGERPEWLKEKYGKVTDQAKAYVEAEKRLGGQKTPENYDLSDYSDYFDLEDNHFGDLKSSAKKHGLSQDAIKDIIDSIIKYQESTLPNVDEELAKFGENAQAKLDVINTWASNTLSEDAIATLGKIGNRAEVFKLFDEIRQKYTTVQSQPPGSMENMAKKEILTEDMVRQKVIDNPVKYKSDAGFRAEIREMFKQVYGED